MGNLNFPHVMKNNAIQRLPRAVSRVIITLCKKHFEKAFTFRVSVKCDVVNIRNLSKYVDFI